MDPCGGDGGGRQAVQNPLLALARGTGTRVVLEDGDDDDDGGGDGGNDVLQDGSRDENEMIRIQPPFPQEEQPVGIVI